MFCWIIRALFHRHCSTKQVFTITLSPHTFPLLRRVVLCPLGPCGGEGSPGTCSPLVPRRFPCLDQRELVLPQVLWFLSYARPGGAAAWGYKESGWRIKLNPPPEWEDQLVTKKGEQVNIADGALSVEWFLLLFSPFWLFF